MRSLAIRSLPLSPVLRRRGGLALLYLYPLAADEAPRRRRPFSSASAPHSPAPYSSSQSSSSAQHSSWRRHHEEESRAVKVAVWWDFENCSIPTGVNVYLVASRITSALRSNGIRGPVTVTAFGDVAQLSRITQEALTSTGVCLTHVPNSGKNSSDRSFIADLVYWVSQNPPPVHFFLISGDKDFANILHRLRMSNYNILLASTDTAPNVLCSAATIMWSWCSLVKGENHVVKHFNHPPDGIYGSWYGHFKGALDNPFTEAEQIASSQPEKSMELISETKLRPVPKAFINALRQILYLYPEGIIPSELRAELKRNNVTLDKDFYGYKKFSNLLYSMGSILKIIPHPSSEGQPLVVGIHRKGVESAEPNPKPQQDVEFNGKEKQAPSAPDTTFESSLSSKKSNPRALDLAEPKPKIAKEVETCYTEKDQASVNNQKPGRVALSTIFSEPSPSHKENDVDISRDASISPPDNDKEDHMGLFQRIQKAFSGFRIALGKGDLSPSSIRLSKVDSIKEDATEDIEKDKANMFSEEQSGVSQVKNSFSSRLAKWWKKWKSGNSDQVESCAPFKEVLDCKKADTDGVSNKSLPSASDVPEGHELFSKSDFWHEVESFLLTSKGSEIVLKSQTRTQLVQRMKQEGPEILKSMREIDLLQLINLLIAEKKLKFSAYETFPFRLSLLDKRECISLRANSSNARSSLSTSRQSISCQQRPGKSEEQDVNSRSTETVDSESSNTKHPQNLSELKTWFQEIYSGVDNVKPEDAEKLFENKFGKKLVYSTYGYSDIRSLIAACLTDTGSNQGKRNIPLSREEILSDCHVHLTELFEQYPEGFNMSIFRPTFMLKFGYILDHQMLGYPKLASLMQIMPGVRLESTFVIPSRMLESQFSWEQADSKPENNSKLSVDENEGEKTTEDCAWEELGPISNIDVCNNSSSTEETSQEDDASFLDEDLSDSDNNDLPSKRSGMQQKCGENSSLLQILDSWYSTKEGSEKEQSLGVDGLVDCSSAKSPTDHKGNPKTRPRKRYSFVSESRDGEKEKLVDSIIGSLKKAGDSRVHS